MLHQWSVQSQASIVSANEQKERLIRMAIMYVHAVN